MAPKSSLSGVEGIEDQRQEWEKDAGQGSVLWRLQLGGKGWHGLWCQEGAIAEVCVLWGGLGMVVKKELIIF